MRDVKKTIKNKYKDLTFKIDQENKTASLFEVNSQNNHLVIPRTVEHESTDYLITSITGTERNISFISGTDTNIIRVEFAENSAVKKIYKDAFKYSNIEEIHFLSSLKELDGGWCSFVGKRKKITVSGSNNRFIFKDDECLLSKNGPTSAEYDSLETVQKGSQCQFTSPNHITFLTHLISLFQILFPVLFILLN